MILHMTANKKNTIEFIHHPDFVKWVLKPSPEWDHYWKTYISENPSREKEFEHAQFIIKGLGRQQKSLTDEEVLLLWDKIERPDILRTRKITHFKRWIAAASILLILGFSGWWLSHINKFKNNEVNYQSIAVSIKPGNDIKLILSDLTEKTFTAEDVELKYDQLGKLETKNGKHVQTEELSKSDEKEQINQIVVPCGKRSTIILADGTKLWLNSGSRAIYPVAFNGKTREIYIEGEGYLEVVPDAAKPFFVVTDQLKVKVLGTKFDISAYKDDDHSKVVLVEGSVKAIYGTESIVMKPNQLLNYVKQTKKSTLEKTNVLEYVSWKDGWLMCNKESIQSITTKLSRYYNVKIICNDLSINSMSLTGKLDLKSNCEDVLKAICTTAPLNYKITDQIIYLTIKK